MSLFTKPPHKATLNTKILFFIILLNLHIILSSSRMIPSPQNLETSSSLDLLSTAPEVHNAGQNLLPMLVKGRKPPPSAPSHRGHKAAMFQQPP
ncbi:hypothetical protein DCAR_0831452 [Daucus carota subsp. sativus]|uniref:Uncharacterized protein n=1 Tax=Daucus carota subsp. sativus TaxID=79200 RepID=A0A175YMX7_DAUCS|nr:hypothetical protein DCAR_0831452 [Daucus carota subsp. sativus]